MNFFECLTSNKILDYGANPDGVFKWNFYHSGIGRIIRIFQAQLPLMEVSGLLSASS